MATCDYTSSVYKIYSEPIYSTYGTIYCLISQDDKHRLVLKKYNDSSNYDKILEGTIMKKLSKYNLIAQVYDLIYCNGTYGLLMPYYEYRLSNLKGTLGQVRSCLYQLLNFLNILQSHGIIHRDLKPNNILIDNKGQIKVIDFGFSCYQNTVILHNVGTIWYRAPEILNNKVYNYKSDLWSIGCCIAELILGEPLFKEEKVQIILEKMDQFNKFKDRFMKEITELINTGRTIDDYLPRWPYLKKLKSIYQFSQDIFYVLMNLLEINPKKRKDARFLLKNHLFNDFNISIINTSENNNHEFPLNLIEYTITVPELSIDQTKYKIIDSQSPLLDSDEPLYKCYNGILNNSQMMLGDGVSFDHESLIKSFCKDIIMQTETLLCSTIQLNLIVQSIQLYNNVVQGLLNPKMYPLAKQIYQVICSEQIDSINQNQLTIDILLGRMHRNNWFNIFKICYNLIVEIDIDDTQLITSIQSLYQELQSDHFCNIKQLIMNLVNYELKQDRKLYYSAHNLHNFSTYNNIYNIMYLTNTLSRKYRYNYVMCCLQKCKHGYRKLKILKDLIPADEIMDAVRDLCFIELTVLTQQLNEFGFSKEGLKDVTNKYKIYCKKYRKNNRIQK